MAGHLLLVDDEPGLREAVSAYLEDSGFTVKVAANGKEAWQSIETDRPDLVISDIMMPQVNGYEFLQKIRSDERFLNLPVIFLTARGMTSDRIKGYQSGVDAYIAKPFDPEELVAIVQNILKRKQMQSSTPEIQNLAGQLAEIRALLKHQQTEEEKQEPDVEINFTPREEDILELVVDGLMNKEIAKRLGTTVRNVEKYVSRLFAKTGTGSRTELVRYALQHHLVPIKKKS
ncbi:MAG: response regulator transcription factor [Pseudanabaenaceae cyanobacterium SKYGB_i_bin29]|nr:response regulator transcription factor [Pseudanabaenaceae cyanobacterium SKYG29]MDW8422508.1 response regulator transcription factor [Pseudanabaenaceae cyanobacterium SKYGB_i_bin29]